MSFQYSAIGDNTPENREHLEKLGYTPLRFYLNGKYLYARSCTWANKNCTWQEPYFATDNNIDNSPKNINCIGNDPLFRAVTAMRDDSDNMQWFTDGRYWLICNYDRIGIAFRDYVNRADWNGMPHKATLSEIQERFK